MGWGWGGGLSNKGGGCSCVWSLLAASEWVWKVYVFSKVLGGSKTLGFASAA